MRIPPWLLGCLTAAAAGWCGALAAGSSLREEPDAAPPPRARSERPARTPDPDAPGPEARYVPAGACASPLCHGPLMEAYERLRHSHFTAKARHPGAGCGVCHGPASDHIEDPEHRRIPRLTVDTPENARRIDRACASCHQETIHFPGYAATEHRRAGLSCASCHEVHYDLGTPFLLRLPGADGPAGRPVPPERRGRSRTGPPPPREPGRPRLERAARTRVPIPGAPAAFARDPATPDADVAVNELCSSCHRRELREHQLFSHHPLAEGRIRCTSCHDPHRAYQGRMLVRRSVEETCIACHQDQRGPFLFEHNPVRAGGVGEGCLDCHRPHGSPNRNLQVLYGRGLCLQCHSDIQQDIPHRFRTGDCWRSGCHVDIHGSNRDPHFLRP